MSRAMRDRRFVLAIAGLVALQVTSAGVAWFARSAAEHRLAEQDRRNADLRFELARATARPAPQPAEPSRWTLLDQPDVAGTMQAIQDVADAVGVALDEVKATPARVSGRQSFQLSGQGTPHQVCSLLAAFEQHDRLLVVESGGLQPGGAGRVHFELGVATYHRGGGQ